MKTPSEMQELEEIKIFARVVDRAMVHVDKYVPTTDRAPTPGGGSVRQTAVGLLVAVRSVLEALREEGEKKD